ncbi:MAG: U32 family peptidase [Acholeplasmataceae bacterium]|nr:U32 family peptidase [Acholeplasmataceae bacterium]
MIELLAPAGDLEKLKIACLYGADAVFVGGKSFSLRSRASNFDLDDIKEGVDFAHRLGKKVYVTTNIIPHDEDLEGLVTYLKALDEMKVDAIICASPIIIRTALKETSLDVHLSTQQSATNSAAIRYWSSLGVKRIVLARELSTADIGLVREKTDLDLEVFIHGGMCMSISGRCSLSDNLTTRDANRGGCAHSCRWGYHLMDQDEPVSDHVFSMSSKDLAALKAIPELIRLGVASLKIEGRMKSLHYIATVVSVYRNVIDDVMSSGSTSDFNEAQKSLQMAENRFTGNGFLEGFPGPQEQLYEHLGEHPSQRFLGIVRKVDRDRGLMIVEQRNRFFMGDKVEVFSPDGTRRTFVIDRLETEDGTPLDVARHPKERLVINMPFGVKPYALIRGVS